jgi:hypothetical protein
MMTENSEQKQSTRGYCGEDMRNSCCEQMMKVMRNHCENGETGFDCTAMMEKMGYVPTKSGENKQ